MINSLRLLGINHHSAPIELRERFSFSPRNLATQLGTLKSVTALPELLILSTCNRTELYFVGGDQSRFNYYTLLKRIFPFVERGDYEHFYRKRGREVVRHLFRVTAGLDSMVLGEPQILGQVKEAYEAALKAGSSRKLLNLLLRQALRAGKRVRNQTGIAQGSLSVPLAAVKLARQMLSTLKGKTIALLGTGKMSQLTARYLMELGASELVLVTRSAERAAEVAGKFKVQTCVFDPALSFLRESDIVICSSSSPHSLITKDAVAKLMKKRQKRPLFLIDIAVPRDVEPAVGRLRGVHLYNIDQLEAVVEDSRLQRESECSKAEKIVSEEVEKFSRALLLLGFDAELKKLYHNLEGTAELETERLRHHLRALSPEERAQLRRFSRLLIRKLLHQPLENLRSLEHAEELESHMEAFLFLFSHKSKGERN